MILLLNTSKPECEMIIYRNGEYLTFSWEANRELADNLLTFISDNLSKKRIQFSQLTGLGVFEGPGSFTGLRIGITVMNTLADSLGIPIVGGRGEEWHKEIVNKIQKGENKSIVLPFYGSEAKITLPKK